ncbi:tannase/feruloyl esterase family alpha/beta hydrolase [Nocardioides gansuensis]|uniref:Tannase/feruloyl esterase family alpha/beta hydrolase n=1 Tax=Nocardioides gansuensis TaxID=2138300 RepID=A0A2T8F6P2_9ACTN|nr:tannase/feruloyl esterase family alpha/beta hydrolase [Nocardioides gansuensis]PVG81376.1 tannase/feruloyl esterase family alpha/beta hydrolase [Nocardioides gansuensis]
MTVITSVRRQLGAAVAGAVGLGLAAIAVPQHVAAAPPTPAEPGCARMSELLVPQAEMQKTACLADLTTAGTVASGHTNPNDWAGLHASGTRNPSGVPGIQVDGYFPDTSTSNTNNGWRHDSQFVIRLPDAWNGKVVITGAPGVRAQYANDFILGDWVLAQGYAFASTDKGNTGARFYADGSTPGGSVREWHDRVTELTKATKVVVEQRYGRAPRHTYLVGISNGGYLTRWQLENRPWLYDGGVDWEGTLFRAEGPTMFHYLPTALRHYPAYAATGSEEARQAMLEAGFEEGSEFLWPFHYSYYWDLTQRIYREEFDPDYDGSLDAGVPFCQSGVAGCDADYDYASRPASVKEAVRIVELTGNIQRPLITLHGDLDALLPMRTDSNIYDELVEDSHQARLHRYYRFGGGTHTDGLYSTYPDRLRPLLPCARSAFQALDQWVRDHVKPPKDGFYPKPTTGDVVNTCVL